MHAIHPARPAFTLIQALLALLLVGFAPAARAQPRHAIAMYGEPALPEGFAALPYVNPDAPQGGRITFAEIGGFDSLNPYILRGSAPWGLGPLTVETLLGRSQDEPFTLYGLLAESVETDADRSFVAFTLREGARFSDGTPVTIEDVIWSFTTLGLEGHPRYRNAWAKVATVEQTGPRTIRLTFTQADRELPLILGLRPILQRAQFDTAAGGRAFAQSSLAPVIGSGPYVVAALEPGRTLTLRRNPDWWGRDLPFNRGQHNFDEVRYEFFTDSNAAFESFKAGLISLWREPSAARWLDRYDFPAMTDGRLRRIEIAHHRPSGMDGFVFNTRRARFADWRVRQALILAFDFGQMNTAINGGLEPRIASFFGNSALGITPGPAQGLERALLEPFAADLPPDALEDLALPVLDQRASRRRMRDATQLLTDAGWTVDDQGILRDITGEAFEFEILLRQGTPEYQAMAISYIEMLRPLGIAARVSVIDSAQYVERTNAFDFDVTQMLRQMSLSPGNEQTLYWGAAGVDQPGSRNWPGVHQPAVDAMIAAMLSAPDPEHFTAAVRALDRVLMAGRYVIPFWYSPVSRIVAVNGLRFPENLPIYGDWTGFLPDVWWLDE